ncbi:hypothetical protein ACSQ76_13635 [Roseovarius sp. B08]|uniref:hypothetical protein n=1 Tax=Roseovarius sp. B08 TaxID=3449223 RepID=UPI003EDBF03B
MRYAFALCVTFLAACHPDNVRLLHAEDAAVDTCACPDRACALRSATPVTEGRGLLMEDYENLPQEEITRYEAAVERITACLTRFDEG